MRAALLAFALAVSTVTAEVAVTTNAADTESNANPIRKVVTMLQAMQKKIAAEGKKEQELYDKFMCYCKNGAGDLSAAIAGAQTKVPQLQSEIESSQSQLAQLKEDLKSHQADRSAAKDAKAKANAIREKEAKAFAKEKAGLDANIQALSKATVAITNGMAGNFLQTRAAVFLRRLVADVDMNDSDREEVTAFLAGKSSQGEGYVPKSGEITGILKTIQEEMEKSLATATANENEAVASFEELVAAKSKEIAALTKAIETKSVRVGELGVEIVTMKNDLTDNEQALIGDTKFLQDLDKNCAAKTKDWDERSKTRSEELLAVSETIKVLNDDDALEMFKKTLPGASSASLVQVKGSSALLRQKALAALRQVQKDAKNPELDFIAMAIEGKKVGFEKVIKLIDDMVANLKKEQVQDDAKKTYCAKQLDESDDKKKGLEQTVSDEETAISDATDKLATLKDEIKALQSNMKKLDKSVAEAGEQRKEEHEDFIDLMASNSAAKEILKFAVNRLNKFYNPKLYKAPPKRDAAAALQLSISFVQIEQHIQKADPGPAPETFDKYEKSGEASNGIVGMINLLVKDLDKEMTEAEAAEENGQKDYEESMKDAAEKRANDSKALTEKSSAKAKVETALEEHKEGKASAGKELMATEQYIHNLHGECDWLLKYFDVRKDARASETDALGKAKAVLSGADYSLLQAKPAFLGRF